MTELVDSLLAARYFRNGETSFEDVCKRVADAIGDTEEERKQYYDAMMNLEFLPNSPTLMNAGTELGQLSACFTLPVGDSLPEIFDAVKWGALIHQSGGGTGYNFSNLRPEGSPVKSTDGVASGAVSFMHVFNAATDVIKQGGRRRGANMGILDVNHPEIMKFLKAKAVEGDLSNFNISVMVNDRFMEAVKNKDFEHFCSSHVVDEIWNAIIDGIYNNGEPGILFYDTINKYNPTPHLGDLTITNPCFAPDTLLLTREGYKPIIELVDKSVEYWNGKEWSECKAYPTGYNSVYRVEFSNGMSVDVTSNHRWFTTEGIKETKDLTTDTKIIKTDYPVCEGTGVIDEPYKRGFFSGDGSECAGYNEILLYPTKEMCFNVEIPLCGHATISCPKEWKKDYVPFGCTKEIICEWLAGLIDADGTRTKDGAIQISSVNRKFLKDVQMLLTTIGIYSTVGVMKHEDVKLMPDGKGGEDYYYCQECYRLSISPELGRLSIPTKRVNTIHTPNRKANRYVKPISITYLKDCDTYCLTEEKRHQVIANGMPTSQCGEQPLLPFESCVLGSINLSKFIKRSKGGHTYVDELGLKRITHMAVRFLDSVIDKNVFPLPQIEEATKKTRKIGLGLMGVHDALIMIGIPYDSQEARSFCERVMKDIDRWAESESIRLAEKKGVFPAYKGSVWDNEVGVLIRNAALTTIAPTGSISLLAGCSSGIEPNFSYVYTRKNTVSKEFEMVHPLFMQELEKLEPEKIDRDYVINEMKTKGSIQHITWLDKNFKSLFKTALDIDWKDHVLMQAAFQKYTHNAISKTINMPESATKKDIADAILLAWKEECKGLTIYRTNSRKDVVLALEDKKKEPFSVRNGYQTMDEYNKTMKPITELLKKVVKKDEKQSKNETKECERSEIPKTDVSKTQYARPRVMNGKTFLAQSGCCRLYVTVNVDDEGKPKEVFISTAGAGCEANSNALGRSISLGLQQGIPYTEYVKSFGKVKCSSSIKNSKSEGTSCADVVGKCIEMAAQKSCTNVAGGNLEPIVVGSICNSINQTYYEKDPNIIYTAHYNSVNKCPECGAVLDFGEGCNMGICKTCGWSGCS